MLQKSYNMSGMLCTKYFLLIVREKQSAKGLSIILNYFPNLAQVCLRVAVLNTFAPEYSKHDIFVIHSKQFSKDAYSSSLLHRARR